MTQSVFEYSNSMEDLPESVIEKNVENIVTLLKEEPSKFEDLFFQQSKQTLLVLLPRLGKIKSYLFILRFFSNEPFLVKKYGVLRNIIRRIYFDDSLMLALLDLVNRLKYSHYTQNLFTDRDENHKENILTEIARDCSENVIKKYFSSVFDFTPVSRNLILETEHIEYNEQHCTSIIKGKSNRYVSYSKNPIEAVFNRYEYPDISLFITKNIISSKIPIKDNLFKKALENNCEEVISYLIERLDENNLQQAIQSIKKEKITNLSIANLINSIPIYHAVTNKTVFNDEIENLIQSSPQLLSTRWSNKNTFLHLAVLNKNITALDFSLNQISNINILNENNQTALDVALYHCVDDCAMLLIDQNEINLWNKDLYNVWTLQRIASRNQYKLTKEFLKKLMARLPERNVFLSLAQTLMDLKNKNYHENDILLLENTTNNNDKGMSF